MLLKIPQKVKSRCMREQYQSVTSSPNSKHSVRPHPLTQHLSLLRTASLFPVCSILLLLSGKLLKSPIDTASSIMTPGFHSTFLTGGGQLLPPLEEGGYPTGPRRTNSKHRAWLPLAWAEVRFVYLPSDFPTWFDKVSNFISSYTVLPFTRTASYQSEIPTILKKRDAHDLKLKETGVHLRAGG